MASSFQNPMAPSLCDHCGIENEDTIRCTVQDNKNLCQDCFQGLPGDPEWVCENHYDRKAEVFCKTCKCGSCKDCAGDIHKDHDVMCVIELAQEIRQDLLAQLQWVDDQAEKLSELQLKITNSIGKTEEPRKFVDKIVDEIKDEIEQKLENDIRQLKERSRLDRQRIEDIHLELKATLRKEKEWRKHRLQEMEKNLLVGQQACKCAKREIKNLLNSNPEKLVNDGTQFSSLVKASSSFQCEREVVNCCREVEANLPQMAEAKSDFHDTANRPCTLLERIAICILVIIIFDVLSRKGNERGNYARDEYMYNFFLTSESRGFTANIVYALIYMQFLLLLKLLILMWILMPICEYDYPFKWKRSFMREIIMCKKMLVLVLEYVVYTVLFLVVTSSAFYFLQLTTVSKNMSYVISILHSCSLLCFMLISNRCKDFCTYARMYKG